MIISMLSYSRSHHRSKFQKLFAVYLKYCGLSAKGFDALHALAITMSYKWTGNAVGTISNTAMQKLRKVIHHFPWIISHDNVNIPFRVSSQRLGNQNEFGSGTAATIFLFKNGSIKYPSNRALQTHRASGIQNQIGTLDLVNLDLQGAENIEKWVAHRILRLLVETPEFDIQTFPWHKALFSGFPIQSNSSPPDLITLLINLCSAPWILRRRVTMGMTAS